MNIIINNILTEAIKVVDNIITAELYMGMLLPYMLLPYMCTLFFSFFFFFESVEMFSKCLILKLWKTAYISSHRNKKALRSFHIDVSNMK